MRAPDFWWRSPPSLLARVLTPASAIWGAVAAKRMQRTGEKAAVPVVCVGNPVAGGAGKTPAAIEIARLLLLAKRRPVFLSRGYGGKLSGPIQVDPKVHTADDVGDEPLLLARTAPCVISGNRVQGAALAATLGDVIVMDDGFQNASLEKDMALLIVDSETGTGNNLCIPAGPLRAPLDLQLTHADAIIVVGDGTVADWLSKRKKPPTLRARLVPDAKAAAPLKGKRVLAFAGIGRPQKFAGTLKGLGAKVVHLEGFPDHHVYTAEDAKQLIAAAKKADLQLVTTEEDRARLTGPALKALAAKVVTVPVRLAFDKPDKVTAGLKKLF